MEQEEKIIGDVYMSPEQIEASKNLSLLHFDGRLFIDKEYVIKEMAEFTTLEVRKVRRFYHKIILGLVILYSITLCFI
jgi:hypothetical protein